MKEGASTIRIFAIADLHLSFGCDKPMEVFGEQWRNHPQRLREAWLQTVHQDDLVLIPGDISWAMREEEAKPDLEFIAQLPGKKVLQKGNHDYWWGTKRKVETLAGADCAVLQNNAIPLDQYTIVGTRGWNLPGSPNFSDDDERLFHREVGRLQLSLREGSRHQQALIAMMHFPPLTQTQDRNLLTELLEDYGVRLCIYGHLHGGAHRTRVEETIRGVTYRLVAADFLRFQPLELTELLHSEN